MTVRYRPSIFEALSPWADPMDAVMLLQRFERDVQAVAAKVGCTELAGYQIFKPLGLTSMTQLVQLKTKGLLMLYRDGSYWVDTRDFARWVDQQCDRLRQLPRSQRPDMPVQSQGTLL